MSETPDPGVRGAAAAFTERRKQRGLTQEKLRAAGVISVSSLIAFEHGRVWPRDRTRAKLENAVGWPVGTLDAIRLGAPTPSVAPVLDDERVWTAPVLAALRQVENIAIQAVRGSRGAPAVIEQLEAVHNLYEELAGRANGIGDSGA